MRVHVFVYVYDSAHFQKKNRMFFFSWDGKYIIKTISEKEVYVMIKMLPSYLQHMYVILECGSVLQCVAGAAVCGSVWQCVAV